MKSGVLRTETCLGTGLLLCRFNHQAAVFSSHLLDLLLAFDGTDHFLLEALCVFASIVPDPLCQSLAFLLASLSALRAYPFLPTQSMGLHRTLHRAWDPLPGLFSLWGHCYHPYTDDSHFRPLPPSFPLIFAIMPAPLPTQTLPHTT